MSQVHSKKAGKNLGQLSLDRVMQRRRIGGFGIRGGLLLRGMQAIRFERSHPKRGSKVTGRQRSLPCRERKARLLA